jgi:hypothetical protein
LKQNDFRGEFVGAEPLPHPREVLPRHSNPIRSKKKAVWTVSSQTNDAGVLTPGTPDVLLFIYDDGSCTLNHRSYTLQRRPDRPPALNKTVMLVFFN